MRRGGLLSMIVSLVVAVSGCSSSSVEIMDAAASLDDTRVELVLASCNAELVVDVSEFDDEVVIAVSDAAVSMLRTSGDACQDAYVVQLDSPLGDGSWSTARLEVNPGRNAVRLPKRAYVTTYAAICGCVPW